MVASLKILRIKEVCYAATVAGYITDTPGIGDPAKDEDPLFAGPPSEQTAYLTFGADTVKIGPVNNNGVVEPFQASSGHFDIYFAADPTHAGRNWNDPTTFTAGHKVPEIPDPAAVVNLERDQSLAFATDILTKHDVTEHLLSSKPFTIPGGAHTT